MISPGIIPPETEESCFVVFLLGGLAPGASAVVAVSESLVCEVISNSILSIGLFVSRSIS